MRGGIAISKSDCSWDVGTYTGEYSMLSGKHGFRTEFCLSLIHSTDDVTLVYTCEIFQHTCMHIHTHLG